MSRVYLDERIVASLIVKIQKDLQQLKSMLGISGEQRINIDSIKLNDTPIKNQIIAPPLTKTEHKKYANDYPRRDIIKFTNMEKGVRRCVVLVNDNEISIEYANFVLLLYFAIALKQEKDLGWVGYDKIGTEANPKQRSERIVRDRTHFQRVICELKMQINPFVEPNINFSIIDNLIRKSKYRLTTMPSRIDTHLKWLRGKYRKIKPEVIKERRKREEDQEREEQRKRKVWQEEGRQKRTSHNVDEADDHMSHPDAYELLKKMKRDVQ